jgi:pyruvate dehydrogenase E2 component (dihydrolipoamide acetyltransferase)
MKIINMPSFGADMAKGEVAQWNVKAGDSVKKGDIIASIETMKGLIDMEIFDDGIIEKLLVDEGIELSVGQPIAELRLANELPADNTAQAVVSNAPEIKQPEQKQPELAAQPVIKTPIVQTSETLSGQGNTAKISPAARQKAKELGIDWRTITQGHGPDDAIVLADIERAGSAKPDEQATNTPMDPMRQAIAAVVSRSKKQIPHYYLQLDIVVDSAQQWLTEHNQSLSSEHRILLNALIYTAIAHALKSFPEFNGFYIDGKFVAAESVHLGNVINLRQGGLVVAAIHDAQSLGCKQMMFKLKDQVIRARVGGLRMSEMQDATVTVSNLGERGCDTIHSIMFSPQVAIVGIGRQRTVPWVVDNNLSIASIVSITLAADHRVSDGHSGARLLNKINQLLQKPERLI